MDYKLLSLEALPFVLPLLVCAIIMDAALFGHLNFKHIKIKNISIIASAVMFPVVVFIVPLIIKMAFDFSISLMFIHAMFAALAFICVLIFSVASPKRMMSPIQLIGVIVFAGSLYSFLA